MKREEAGQPHTPPNATVGQSFEHKLVCWAPVEWPLVPLANAGTNHSPGEANQMAEHNIKGKEMFLFKTTKNCLLIFL